MKFLEKNKGFSLVELMVVISIIAILAAVAIPAYSNYVMRVRFQDEINKMDNYRKAIGIFIQETGVTSNEEFQSEIANVKENYLGDANVAIMSEVQENNGRLLAHPVINGTTYQVALTPRINDNGSLVNWECSIRNETDNSAPPSSSMPNGCNVAAEDLNDDQVAYTSAFGELMSNSDGTGWTDLIGSENESLQSEYNDLLAANSDDSLIGVSGSVAFLNDKINDTMSMFSDDIFYSRKNAGNNEYFDTQLSDAETALSNAGYSDDDITNLANSDLSTLENSLSSLQNNGSALTTDSSQDDIDSAGLTQLKNYRDGLDSNNFDTEESYNSAYNTANTNYNNRLDQVNLKQDEIDYVNASQNEAAYTALYGDDSTGGYVTALSDKKQTLLNQAKDNTNYVSDIKSINQNSNEAFSELNSSDAYGQNHVTTREVNFSDDSNNGFEVDL